MPRLTPLQWFVLYQMQDGWTLKGDTRSMRTWLEPPHPNMKRRLVADRTMDRLQDGMIVRTDPAATGTIQWELTDTARKALAERMTDD